MNKMQLKSNGWLNKIGWLVVIWAGSVGALAVVAYGMRALMHAAGITV